MKKILLSVVLLFSSGVLVSTFISDKPVLEPLSDKAVILAFGDSLTKGTGVRIEYSYPSVLSKKLNRTVINAGKPGEMTEQGLQRFESVIKQHNPELVILLEGGNDILRNKSFASIKANLSAMIETARQKNIQTILIGVPEKGLFLSSAEFYAELAEEQNLVYEGDILPDLLSSNKYKSDVIHLNKEGYAKLAEGIYQLLLERGAVQ